jgi:hypothetical protein
MNDLKIAYSSRKYKKFRKVYLLNENQSFSEEEGEYYYSDDDDFKLFEEKKFNHEGQLAFESGKMILRNLCNIMLALPQKTHQILRV